MLPSFYWPLLFFILIYALLCGKGEHRVAAIGCVIATFATRYFRSPTPTHFQNVEAGILFVDLALFGLFVAIALRSKRFWPLWISGFHLVAVAAHITRAFKVDLMPTVYAAATQFWSYPVLFCIGIAIWRSQQRQVADTLANPLLPAASA